MPACGVMRDEIAKAMASGSATRPTVTPAIKSETNSCRVYWRSARKDAGRNRRWPERVWGNDVERLFYSHRRRQAFQERDEILEFALAQIERPDVQRLAVALRITSALVVEAHDFVEGCLRAVVLIRSGHRDVTQARRLERAAHLEERIWTHLELAHPVESR